jgi:S-adenosylmethionine hydrolase
MVRLGGDPKKINPLVPVDLIIDHSVQVDRFGNLTTNIGRRQLIEAQTPSDGACVVIRVGGQTLKGLYARYADVPVGRPLALVGSRELLEIAVNQGNAQRHLGVARGDAVELVW